MIRLIHKLLDALRIRRPWAPGLIRGGEGRLPNRVRAPLSATARRHAGSAKSREAQTHR